VLTDEIACLVAPEPDAMARGLIDLLRDRGRRDRLAASAREFAQRELTRAAFERKVLRFYELIGERLSGSPSPARAGVRVGEGARG
jgi:glycosyltransferase involved in cell wall biosynthesis